MNKLEATLKVLLNAQSYLYGRLRQFEAELYGEKRELTEFMEEWDKETLRQIEELTSGQTNDNS